MAIRTAPARRFKATAATTMRDLQATVQQMGATSLDIGQNFSTGEYRITFDRAGRRYVFRCSRWPHAEDNLRAAQRTISLLWQAMEEYGTVRTVRAVGGKDQKDPEKSGQETKDDAFTQFFLPFEALPDDRVLLLSSGARSWWDILGVSPTASRIEMENAYRALARRHHPDVGGDAEDFKRLRTAYEDGLRERGVA